MPNRQNLQNLQNRRNRRNRHRSRRRARTLVLLAGAAAALAAVALLVTDAGAAPAHHAAAASAAVPAPGPGDDSFYVPPNPLPAGSPGDTVRWRPAVAGAPEVNASVWQVMYLSTDAMGHPDAVTGTILVPRGVDASAAPIVGFAPGTEGPAFRCATSKMIQTGAYYEQTGVDDLLTSGYAVAVTDYEGYQPTPHTTYVVGQSEGHAVIDMVRAASRLPAAGLSATSKVVFRGYSQGGGAVMWAGQMQPAYAPELNLVGVAGGGVPANLAAVAAGLDGKWGFGVEAYAVLALDHAYPELNLAGYLDDAGKTFFAGLEQNDCLLELVTDNEGKSIKDYTTTNPFGTTAWLTRVRQNLLGTQPIKVPVFDYGAVNDQLVAPAQQNALQQAYCSLGVTLTWKTYPVDHITGVYLGNADVLAFLKDRLAGRPATSTCPPAATSGS